MHVPRSGTLLAVSICISNPQPRSLPLYFSRTALARVGVSLGPPQSSMGPEGKAGMGLELRIAGPCRPGSENS